MSAAAEHEAAKSPPALSVVIVVFAGGDALGHALAALDAQTSSATLEIIIATAPGTLDQNLQRHAASRGGLVYGSSGAHPAQLRALGVAAATAPVVACIEDHCRPRPDWAASVLAAHARSPGAVVIGGAIDKAMPDSAIAWAAYLLEYGRYMPPLAGGPAAYLSDCNVSYKRAALWKIEDVWRDAFHETAVHQRVRGEWGAAALQLDPAIVVEQSRRPPLRGFLRERYAHGRLFASLRAEHYSLPARAAYGVAALGLTPMLVLRAMGRVWSRPAARSAALAALPHLILAAASWSAGESAGALRPRAS